MYNYVSRRQNTVAQFVVTRPIMDLFLAVEQILGQRFYRRWWDKDRVDVEGMWTADQEKERKEGGGGDGWDSNEDGRIIRWAYTVVNVILGTEHNVPLASTPGLELYHPIMSMLGGHGGQLEREREIISTS